MISIHRSLSLSAVLLLAFGGSEACASGGSGGGSKTDWLACTTDADCPDGDRCVENRCVSPAEAGVVSSGSGGAGGDGTGGTRATGGHTMANGGVSNGSGGATVAGGRDAGLPPSTGGRDASAADASATSGDASHVSDSSTVGAGGSDASSVIPSLDGGTPMLSCLPGGDGLINCGTAQENCCTSLPVPGGTFFRAYTNDGSGPVGEADPATVSSFRLDKYDVTVGRFRRFVSAWNAGWRPDAGSGKHTYLSGGQGLSDQATGSGFEPGWATADEAHVVLTDDQLACRPTKTSEWTPSPDAHETLPMGCVNWWEAYAFCIWDGGFLPTEAEWEYAAAGGSEQRQYSWGSAAPGTNNQYAIYDCHWGPFDGGNCGSLATVANIAPVGSAPSGAGAFGQLDLIGNVLTWVLDTPTTSFGDPLPNPCTDCTYLPAPGSSSPGRFTNGGIFGADGLPLSPWVRLVNDTSTTYSDIGFRCARAPE